MKVGASFLLIICAFVVSGCTQSVSVPLREIASEFVSYFAGKEILDPIFYPDKSEEERKRLKEELGKEIFNHIWADFGWRCKKGEGLRDCKTRITRGLREWTDLYTEEFVSLYSECREEELHKKYQKNDILKLFNGAEECVVAKDSRYKTLFELSRQIKTH